MRALPLQLSVSALLLAACAGRPEHPPATTDAVGRKDDGAQTTPTNQTLTPHGRYVDLPGLRPGDLAMSGDGRHVYVSGKTSELLVIDGDDGAIVQRVPFPSERQLEPIADFDGKQLSADDRALLSYTGLLTAPDGRLVYASNVRGSIKVFAVDADGVVHPSHTIAVPPAGAPRRSAEIPSGLALSADGARLYVCANLSNRLHEIDTVTGAVLRTVDVGVAPYAVVLTGGRAFVSNWGGRRPGAGDLVGPAGRGTTVRVDPVRHIASEGSVSVIDLDGFTVQTETRTGLHASALACSPDGRFVVCANAGSDTISVLDAATGAQTMTICARSKPSDLLTASPNALCFDPTGGWLYVGNGTMNAVGVVRFEPEEPEDCRLRGLIPVGWYPAAVRYDAGRDQLVVANLKGLTEGRARKLPDATADDQAAATHGAQEFNTHQYHGSLCLFPAPDDDALPALSAQVENNLRRPAIERALLPPRPGVTPRAIPERIGEPSLIQHVVYVIKENRTYDQVLGDMPEGNGDPELCVFGEAITPNQHALARQFVLFDNTYCAGILSADGHQWSTAAFASDYLERSFAGWPRSYPDGMGEDEDDALSYSPAGFLWDHAIARGVSLRNFGEFCAPAVRWKDEARGGAPDFRACYAAWRDGGDDVVFAAAPMIPSLLPYTETRYVGWNMSVPDQHRADVFLQDLAEREASGEYPQLTLVCLPNDHTSGTSRGCPTPRACMADNDLALGRIVEGLSRSRFWPKMAILVIEDDPQAGWDHVSGYRTTAYLASPFARRGAVVSAHYNTTSILRTIEQILGIPPMNVFDASAAPLFECFQDTPDLTPFTALPATIALDEMNPEPAAIADPTLRADAIASAGLDLSAMDRAPEDLLNRILWRAMRGAEAAYPEWAITPGADDDDDDR